MADADPLPPAPRRREHEVSEAADELVQAAGVLMLATRYLARDPDCRDGGGPAPWAAEAMEAAATRVHDLAEAVAASLENRAQRWKTGIFIEDEDAPELPTVSWAGEVRAQVDALKAAAAAV